MAAEALVIKLAEELGSIVASEVVKPVCSSLLNNLPLWMSILASFRLLKVLDLEGAPIEFLPKAVTSLFNLRYLGLRGTNVQELPRSIGRLQNLKTLDLFDCSIEMLPREVTKLAKLRHLFVGNMRNAYVVMVARDRYHGSFLGVIPPEGLGKLRNLRTLQVTQASDEMVREMVGMRSLRITRVRGIHCTEMCHSLTKMGYLENLGIRAINETEVLQLEELEQIAHNLKKLDITGSLGGVLPVWFNSLTSLRTLWLGWSGLEEDPLPCLGSLPNLAALYLYVAYDGERLCFKAGGFSKLKVLELCGSTRLEAVNIEEGALSILSELRLVRCIGLRQLPAGIEHFTKLQGLYMLLMPVEFVRRLRRDDTSNPVEDVEKVEHIPVIQHTIVQGSKWVHDILS